MSEDEIQYELLIAAGARRALSDQLPEAMAFAAWEFINGPLRRQPYRVGRQLQPPFETCWTARRGAYRIRYEIDDDKTAIRVLSITHRADSYYTGQTR